MIGPGYRLFLDTAETAAWRRWAPLGLFHGVTTNPTLLKRAGLACDEATIAGLVEAAAALSFREIHVQSWGGTEAVLRDRGRRLAALAPACVLIKLPCVPEGFAAAGALVAEGVRVTMTALYAPAQAVAAAALGAAYAAPYLGRLADAGQDAPATIAAMRAALRTGGDRTRLLVASLRQATQIADLAGIGCDTFTMAPAVAAALLEDPASTRAAAAFESDAQPPP